MCRRPPFSDSLEAINLSKLCLPRDRDNKLYTQCATEQKGCSPEPVIRTEEALAL